uniref:Predicted gene, 28053 n=1 Tax=Mus musculus TaxID=10090 RepID=D3YZL2_MOUSE
MGGRKMARDEEDAYEENGTPSEEHIWNYSSRTRSPLCTRI